MLNFILRRLEVLHVLGDDGSDIGDREGCQESKEVSLIIPFLDLALGLPLRDPNPGVEVHRSVLAEREPDIAALGLIELAERREWPDTAVLSTTPALPVRRGGVADVRHAGIALRCS